MDRYSVTPVSRVRQAPARGQYDKDVVHGILDEGWVAHIGFAHSGAQIVIPTFYVRDGEAILIHGSRKARMFRQLAEGVPLSACITLLDGLVLARSAFHHSMNYRSVVIHGSATALTGSDKARGLDLFVERISRGRTEQLRPMNKQEDKATMVLKIPLETVAAKTRSGPPKDDDEDLDWPVWAGVVPIASVYGTPEPDERTKAGLNTPAIAR